MRLRKAGEEDAGKVADVLLQSYNIQSRAEAVEAFKRELRQEKNFVIAEEKDAVIGLASWQMHDVPRHQLAELHRIAVMPDFRGKGIAKPLFQFMVEDCKGFYARHGENLRKLFVLTHFSNKRAHCFYEKLGFRQEARLPNHYYDGEDEVVYSMFFKRKR